MWVVLISGCRLTMNLLRGVGNVKIINPAASDGAGNEKLIMKNIHL
jgi:hypothetical protein